MLERYYVRPDTVDRVRSCWIAEAIESYITWLSDQQYAFPSISRRIPFLVGFGEFARSRGAARLEDLPAHLEAFVQERVRKRMRGRKSEARRQALTKELRIPIEQMLRVTVPDFALSERRNPENPFWGQAPGFFDYLREERGLRPATLDCYSLCLRQFGHYLTSIDVRSLKDLSPPILSGFVIDLGKRMGKASVGTACAAVRVFLGYLYREALIGRDLSPTVEHPQTYRLSHIPRSITWDEVRRMLEVVDRRTPIGKRDYAILLLLVTYGLRAREVASLTLEDIDWRKERLAVRERKAEHAGRYPLSALVAQAILEYLKAGRPQTSHRHIFLRERAPRLPLPASAISLRASHYLNKAGIGVPRAGSHTLRHSCVQRLVDAEFSLKVIGDYVGHRSPASTQIYSKVAIEALREVACGDGEEVL